MSEETGRVICALLGALIGIILFGVLQVDAWKVFLGGFVAIFLYEWSKQ